MELVDDKNVLKKLFIKKKGYFTPKMTIFKANLHLTKNASGYSFFNQIAPYFEF